MSTGVAIFAKTIGLSPVKTRLAKGIGRNKAEEFYILSVDAIEESLSNLRNYTNEDIVPYWAIAEEDGYLDDRWKRFKIIWTGEGGLGKRMFNVHADLLDKHDKVIIIGTDIPQLEETTIVEAIINLDKDPENCVIGPAHDGGFYLFGCKNLVKEEIWTSVTYSKEDTLEQLLLKLDNEDISYSFTKMMNDVDDLSDLKSLREALSLIENKWTKSQKKLIDWLEAYR